MSNKLGLIKIHNEFLKQHNLKCIAPIFTKFIPLTIDKNQDPRSSYYYGYCESFEEVKEGWCIPQYDFTILFENGEYKVTDIQKV